MKRATISQPKVNLESSELEVSEAETLNDHEELGEGDNGEHDEEGAEATTQDESPQENETAAAEEAAAAVATAIGLPEPDNAYDQHLKVIVVVTMSFETPFWQKIILLVVF